MAPSANLTRGTRVLTGWLYACRAPSGSQGRLNRAVHSSSRPSRSLALGIALAALPNVFRLSRRPARGFFSSRNELAAAPTAPSSCRPAEPRQPHSISSMALYATSTVGNTAGNDRFIPTAQ